MTHYDGILLSSFGGPEGPDDVMPFLRRVTGGRGVPEERLEAVAEHYYHFGGVSPINEQNRQLKVALETELAARGRKLPIYWGNRNWAPYFPEAVTEAHAAGHDRLLAIVTSAYTSYSGVGQYRENFEETLDETGLRDTMTIDRVREYFDHPGFVHPLIEGVQQALTELEAEGHASSRVHILFSTHSIPMAAANASGPEFGEGGAYAAQHLAVAKVIADQAATGVSWSLVYQSRSGDPRTPWLEPDINDSIASLAATGDASAVVVVPVGFVSDHMEVLWDLDNEAKDTAATHGLGFRRVPTPGTHPDFVRGLADLVIERLDDVSDASRPHLTALGPWPDHPSVGVPTPGLAANELREAVEQVRHSSPTSATGSESATVSKQATTPASSLNAGAPA